VSRGSRPRADHARKHDLSPPLRTIPTVIRSEEEVELSPNPGLPGRGYHAQVQTLRGDPRYTAISTAPAGPMPLASIAFAGIAQSDGGGVPPDTNGAVGPHHYVQYINAKFAIWDKAGNLVQGPLSI